MSENTGRKSHTWETDFIPSVKSQVQVQPLKILQKGKLDSYTC